MPNSVEYKVIQSEDNPEEWIVEAIDFESEGEIYTAIFGGWDAEKRAEEYANWKNGTSIQVPTPVDGQR